MAGPPEENLSSKIEGLNRNIDSAKKALDDLLATSLTGGQAFDSLASSILEVSDALSKTIGDTGRFIGMLPGGSVLSKPFELMSGIIGSVSGGLGKLIGLYSTAIRATDSITATHRKLYRETYNVAAGFGQSFDAAKLFTDYILSTADKLSTEDFGHIIMKESADAFKALADSSISFNTIASNVQTAVGSLELYNAAILHAQSLGIDVTKYANLLSNAIMKQGLSAQEAMMQLASYKDIAAETGLALVDIANGLQGLSNNFVKLGMSADFGRPLLEGFTRTLTDMGLGIENAIELSSSLGSAIGKLSTNYSAAYLTMQRGGFDLAGGGALAGGITLQAQMLNPEVDQAELAAQMTTAMRDTLSSFTGGQIVTVQEAAMDPALQATFYAQTQLLGNLYDIQDPQTAARTLDLMAQLDDAMMTGNKDQVDSLNEQIVDATKGRESILSNWQKLNTETEGQKARLLSINQAIISSANLTGLALTQAITGPQKDMMNAQVGFMQTLNDNLSPEETQKKLDELSANLKTWGTQENIEEFLKNSLDNLADGLANNNLGPQQVADIGVVRAIDALAQKIGQVLNIIQGSAGRSAPGTPGASGSI